MLRDFKYFCEKRVYVLLVLIGGLSAYGILLFNPMIGIDDESLSYYIESGLIAQNRVGWSLTSKIINIYELLPFWTHFIGLILFILSVCMIVMLADNVCGNRFSKLTITLCICMGFSFPYISKFAIYEGNLATIGLCLGLSALAVYFYELFWNTRLVRYIFTAVLCMWGIFLFEKAYIIYVFQIWFMIKLVSGQVRIKDFFKLVIYLATGILVYCLSYFSIFFIQQYTKIAPSGYTSFYIKYSFTGWNEFINTIKTFLTDYFDMLARQFSTTGGFIIIAAMVIILFYGIFYACKTKQISYLAGSIGCVILSNSIYLITGNANMPLRTICFSYALCVISAFLCLERLFLDLKLTELKIAKFRFLVYCILLLKCSIDMENVFNTKYISYSKDVAMMKEIMFKIYEADGLNTNRPVVFMGIPNNSNYSWKETEESSIFVWDRAGSDFAEERSERIYNFFRLHGYDINRPASEADYKMIRNEIATMESFPSDTSIKVLSEYIICKLGDSSCEILNSDQLMQYVKLDSTNIFYNMDYFYYNNRYVSCGGYLALKDSTNFSNNYSIIFNNENNIYKIRTMEVTRQDITEYFNNGINFDNTGFKIDGYVSNYVNPGYYQIFIGIENGNEKFLVDTGLSTEINQ